jgi:hypothetical protein
MWKPTEYEDLHRIVIPNNPSLTDARALLPETDESRAILKELARTWWDNKEILAIVGIAPLWKGVGTVWTLLTDESRNRGVLLSLGVTRFLDILHVERGYWRLQATTERGDETARLWIIRLGFQYEGTMTAYAPDAKTHDMYARLRF